MPRKAKTVPSLRGSALEPSQEVVAGNPEQDRLAMWADAGVLDMSEIIDQTLHRREGQRVARLDGVFARQHGEQSVAPLDQIATGPSYLQLIEQIPEG
jgi:hypothetical protein